MLTLSRSTSRKIIHLYCDEQNRNRLTLSSAHDVTIKWSNVDQTTACLRPRQIIFKMRAATRQLCLVLFSLPPSPSFSLILFYAFLCYTRIRVLTRGKKNNNAALIYVTNTARLECGPELFVNFVWARRVKSCAVTADKCDILQRELNLNGRTFIQVPPLIAAISLKEIALSEIASKF